MAAECFQPLLQLERAGKEEAGQKVPPVQPKRFCRIAPLQRAAEFSRIAGKRGRVDAEALAAAALDHVRAERAPQVMNRLTETVARVLFRLLRPEQTQKCVATCQGGVRNGEVTQQGEAPGLLQHRRDRPPIGLPKLALA